MAKQWIVGNWKMHGSSAMVEELLSGLLAGLGGTSAQAVVCPPFPYLAQAAQLLAGSPVLLGAQTLHQADSGAFTGEVSASMLTDLGVNLCIVGHSERRHVFGEQNAAVGEKAKAAVAAGMRAILCVGETLAQREAGQQAEVVTEQITAGMSKLEAADCDKLLVSYEPVWAIGTGKTATPEQAQTMHAAIRKLVGKQFGEAQAKQVPILYGGSVNASNAAGLLGQTDIDGALVGGASLKADAFLGILAHAR